MDNLTILPREPNHFFEVQVGIVPKDMDDWCAAAFPQDCAVQIDYTWYGGTVTDRIMQFRFERDLTAFMLRWA